MTWTVCPRFISLFWLFTPPRTTCGFQTRACPAFLPSGASGRSGSFSSVLSGSPRPPSTSTECLITSISMSTWTSGSPQPIASSCCFFFPLGLSTIVHTDPSAVFFAVPFAFRSDFPYSGAQRFVFTVFNVRYSWWPIAFRLGSCRALIAAGFFVRSVIVGAFWSGRLPRLYR